MNEIIDTFLLAEGKFMPEMHLRQTGFTYSACGPFTKNKERIKKDNACFQHNTALMEILKISIEQLLIKYCTIKHLILLKILNMMNINVDLLQWFTNFLIKKNSGSGIKSKNISNNYLKNYTNGLIL